MEKKIRTKVLTYLKKVSQLINISWVVRYIDNMYLWLTIWEPLNGSYLLG
jgi:hypothetical protein